MAQNTVTYSINITFDGVNAQYAGTLSADSLPSVIDTIPVSTTNKEYDTFVRAAGLVGWFLLAVGGNLTLKTNSTSAPDSTISLVDGKAQFWINGTGPANSITVDVQKWFVTNPSGSVTPQLFILPLCDNSP